MSKKSINEMLHEVAQLAEEGRLNDLPPHLLECLGETLKEIIEWEQEHE